MKKIITFFIIIICLSNCIYEKKGQNMQNNRIEILKRNNFKFPDNQQFRERIKLIFGINTDSISENKFYLEVKPIIPDVPDFYPTIYLKEKYLDADNFKNDLSFASFNKYIFYQDSLAFNYLKQNDNYYLYVLVQDYGYYDNQLLEYTFTEIKNDLDTPFAYAIFFGRTGINGKWELRRKIFKQYINQYPHTNISATSFIAPILKENNPYEGNRDYDVAFILNELVIRNQNQNIYPVGEIDYIFNKYPDYLKRLKNNEYYSFSKLKLYSENQIDLNNNLEYYIQDPDGYANLRKEKNSKSEIIQQIKSGGKVEVLDNESSWWLIKTKEGKQGYIYYDRIKAE